MRAGCLRCSALTAARIVGPGRQPVINQNDGPTVDIRRRSVASIEPLAPRHLLQLAPHDRVDLIFPNDQTVHDFIVQNAETAARDRAHRQLFVTGNTQLSHHKNIEGRAKRSGHFQSDGHPAARQRQHKNIATIGVRRQLLRELAAGIGAIAKALRLHVS